MLGIGPPGRQHPPPSTFSALQCVRVKVQGFGLGVLHELNRHIEAAA